MSHSSNLLSKPYRLALDLGSNSIGWAVYDLNEVQEVISLRRLGVRVFPDGRNPKDGSSLAAARRGPRQSRRMRDRYVRRRDQLMGKLIEFGLMPENESERKQFQILDPYRLRGLALSQKISLFELGRALFHLSQRRGFKSNRKTDAANDDESGKIKSALAKVTQQMMEQGVQTIGEYFFKQRYPNGAEQPPVHSNQLRARLQGMGAKAYYDVYLSRQMVEAEFELLWQSQQQHHGDAVLSESNLQTLKQIVFYQRKLHKKQSGPCRFDPPKFKDDLDGYRAHLALPSQQHYRIYNELHNLRYYEPHHAEYALTLAQRNLLFDALQRDEKLRWKQIRRLLDLPASIEFNLAKNSSQKEGLKGNSTSVSLANPNVLGEAWYALSRQVQDAIVFLLLDEENEIDLIKKLINQYEFTQAQAEAATHVKLMAGYGSLGRRALSRLLPIFEESAELRRVDDVIAEVYGSHSQTHDGVIHDELPYYGEILSHYTAGGTGNANDQPEKRWGKIGNPTVHVGLNQMRVVVNALIQKYGKPAQVVIELARELKQSREQKEKLQKEQAANHARNEGFRQQLRSLGQTINSDNMMLLKLWSEQQKNSGGLGVQCIYSGESLSLNRLFSDEVEVDHILPFSTSLDDSLANKILCTRKANRDKAKRTPYEAFAHSPAGYDWQSILARVQQIQHRGKQQRFSENAMDWYLRDEQDFLARHLNDTAYLARVAKQYIEGLFPPVKGKGAQTVWVTPGRLTGLLRAKWGLNKLLGSVDKNRESHFHHAIDAAVIGLTERSILKQVSDAAKSHDDSPESQARLLANMPNPQGLVDSVYHVVEAALNKVVVSYKPDHGTEGQLHKDTNYGIRSIPDKTGKSKVVHRIPLEDLKSAKDIEKISECHGNLKDLLREATRDLEGKDFKFAVSQFCQEYNVQSLKVEENLRVISIKNKQGQIYRGVAGDSNYCYEIFVGAKGRWDGEVIDTFTANQQLYREFMYGLGTSSSLGKPKKFTKQFHQQSFSGKPLIMRLRKNDMLAIEDNGRRRIMRVAKFSDGLICLAEHLEANVDARDRDKNNSFKYLIKSPNPLKDIKARLVFVTPLGDVHDPGFEY